MTAIEPIPFAASARPSLTMRSIDFFTYGQWLQMNITTSPFSPRAVASEWRWPSTPSRSNAGAFMLGLRDRHAFRHRRPRADGVVPALHVRKFAEIDAVPLVTRNPGVDGHVGDRVFIGEGFAVGEMLVHHAVQALGFVAVALAAIRNLVLLRAHEVVRLAEHRAHAAHLEHEPLQCLVLAAHRARQELARLAREVEQD